MPSRIQRERGFTLIELLVAIAIIAVLIALLLPAVQQAREAARRTQCRNNLKQIGLALHNYHDQALAFPPITVTGPCEWSRSPFGTDAVGWWPWRVRILPYIDQGNLYDEFDLDEDAHYNLAKYEPQMSQNIPLFLCPSDLYAERVYRPTGWWQGEPIGFASSNYFVCMGGNGLHVRDWFYPNWDNPTLCARHRLVNPMRPNPPYNGIFWDVNQATPIGAITDGTAYTILLGERPGDSSEDGPQLGWWAYGAGFDTFGNGDHGLDCSEGLYKGDHSDPWAHMTHFWSLHPGGAHFTMGDGSVHFLSYSIDYNLFTALGSKHGGEVVLEF
ncbi:MAG: DUF1559 domain-containing protein [Planctomycetaceae bacterium]